MAGRRSILDEKAARGGSRSSTSNTTTYRTSPNGVAPSPSPTSPTATISPTAVAKGGESSPHIITRVPVQRSSSTRKSYAISLDDGPSDDAEIVADTDTDSGSDTPAGPSCATAEDDATPPPYSFPPPPSLLPLHPSSPLSPQALRSQELERSELARQHAKFPGLPSLDYKQYSPSFFTLSRECDVLSSKAPYLSANVGALVSCIRGLATVPPKPQVHVTGTRGRRTDFSIKLNLMHLLVPTKGKRRMDYLRCVMPGELALRGGSKPDVHPQVGTGCSDALAPLGSSSSSSGGGGGELEAWARKFVHDSASVKAFTLERQVANLDKGWIEGQLRSLVAATKYKGNVTVTFPVTHAKVTVQNPDRFGKVLTAVSGLFVAKKQYEVVKAVWPFASAPNGERDRVCVVQSEETWWREWKDPIRYAVATKRQGWVTNEDKLEAIMEGKGKGVEMVDWGPDYEC
ncbi:hypothetical protein MKZ38_005054 [Zalerion maritima]|uniref:Uncharacterized protein n=1 Tax=Zalerion maritima TaxID=339359 RepID=A0AAD5RKY5_9PEZI|nr:hypothetical protein MKZ38_005054 [Zalerion maritima]